MDDNEDGFHWNPVLALAATPRKHGNESGRVKDAELDIASKEVDFVENNFHALIDEVEILQLEKEQLEQTILDLRNQQARSQSSQHEENLTTSEDIELALQSQTEQLEVLLERNHTLEEEIGNLNDTINVYKDASMASTQPNAKYYLELQKEVDNKLQSEKQNNNLLEKEVELYQNKNRVLELEVQQLREKVFSLEAQAVAEKKQLHQMSEKIQSLDTNQMKWETQLKEVTEEKNNIRQNCEKDLLQAETLYKTCKEEVLQLQADSIDLKEKLRNMQKSVLEKDEQVCKLENSLKELRLLKESELKEHQHQHSMQLALYIEKKEYNMLKESVEEERETWISDKSTLLAKQRQLEHRQVEVQAKLQVYEAHTCPAVVTDPPLYLLEQLGLMKHELSLEKEQKNELEKDLYECKLEFENISVQKQYGEDKIKEQTSQLDEYIKKCPELEKTVQLQSTGLEILKIEKNELLQRQARFKDQIESNLVEEQWRQQYEKCKEEGENLKQYSNMLKNDQDECKLDIEKKKHSLDQQEEYIAQLQGKNTEYIDTLLTLQHSHAVLTQENIRYSDQIAKEEAEIASLSTSLKQVQLERTQLQDQLVQVKMDTNEAVGSGKLDHQRVEELLYKIQFLEANINDKEHVRHDLQKLLGDKEQDLVRLEALLAGYKEKEQAWVATHAHDNTKLKEVLLEKKLVESQLQNTLSSKEDMVAAYEDKLRNMTEKYDAMTREYNKRVEEQKLEEAESLSKALLLKKEENSLAMKQCRGEMELLYKQELDTLLYQQQQGIAVLKEQQKTQLHNLTNELEHKKSTLLAKIEQLEGIIEKYKASAPGDNRTLLLTQISGLEKEAQAFQTQVTNIQLEYSALLQTHNLTVGELSRTQAELTKVLQNTEKQDAFVALQKQYVESKEYTKKMQESKDARLKQCRKDIEMLQSRVNNMTSCECTYKEPVPVMQIEPPLACTKCPSLETQLSKLNDEKDTLFHQLQYTYRHQVEHACSCTVTNTSNEYIYNKQCTHHNNESFIASMYQQLVNTHKQCRLLETNMSQLKLDTAQTFEENQLLLKSQEKLKVLMQANVMLQNEQEKYVEIGKRGKEELERVKKLHEQREEEHAKHLKAKLLDKTMECDKVCRELTQAQASLEKWKQEERKVNALEDEIRKEKELRNSQNMSIRQLESNSSTLNREIVQLQENLRVCTLEKSTLDENLRDISNKYHDIKVELDNQQGKSREYVKKMESELSQSSFQVQTTQIAHSQQLDSFTAEFQRQLDTLTLEKQDLQRKVLVANSQIEQLKVELSRKNNDTRIEVEKVRTETSHLQTHIEQLKTNFSKEAVLLKETYTQKEEAVHADYRLQLDAQVHTLNITKQDYEAKLHTIQRDMAVLRSKETEASNQVQSLRVQVSAEEKQKELLMVDISKFLVQVDELKLTLQDKDILISLHKSNIAALQDKLKTSEGSLEQQVNKYVEYVSENTTQHTKLQDEILTLKQQIEEQLFALRVEVEEKEKYMGMYNASMVGKDGLQAKVTELEEKEQIGTNVVLHLESTLANAEHQVQSYKAKIGSLQEQQDRYLVIIQEKDRELFTSLETKEAALLDLNSKYTETNEYLQTQYQKKTLEQSQWYDNELHQSQLRYEDLFSKQKQVETHYFGKLQDLQNAKHTEKHDFSVLKEKYQADIRHIQRTHMTSVENVRKRFQEEKRSASKDHQQQVRKLQDEILSNMSELQQLKMKHASEREMFHTKIAEEHRHLEDKHEEVIQGIETEFTKNIRDVKQQLQSKVDELEVEQLKKQDNTDLNRMSRADMHRLAKLVRATNLNGDIENALVNLFLEKQHKVEQVMGDHHQIIRAVDEQVYSLRCQLKEKDTCIKVLEKQVQTLQKEMQVLSNRDQNVTILGLQNQQINNQVILLKQEKEYCMKQIEQQQAQLAQSIEQAQFINKEQLLHQDITTHPQLRDKISTLLQENQDLKAYKDKFDQTALLQNNKLRVCYDKQVEKTNTCDQLEDKCSQLQEYTMLLQTKLQNVQYQNQKLENKADEYEVNYNSEASKQTQYILDIDTLQCKLDMKESVLAEHQHIITSLQNNLQLLQTQLKQEQTEKNSYMRQVYEFEVLKQKYEHLVKDLKTQLEKKAQHYTQTIQTLQTQVQSLEREKQHLEQTQEHTKELHLEGGNFSKQQLGQMQDDFQRKGSAYISTIANQEEQVGKYSSTVDDLHTLIELLNTRLFDQHTKHKLTLDQMSTEHKKVLEIMNKDHSISVDNKITVLKTKYGQDQRTFTEKMLQVIHSLIHVNDIKMVEKQQELYQVREESKEENKALLEKQAAQHQQHVEMLKNEFMETLQTQQLQLLQYFTDANEDLQQELVEALHKSKKMSNMYEEKLQHQHDVQISLADGVTDMHNLLHDKQDKIELLQHTLQTSRGQTSM